MKICASSMPKSHVKTGKQSEFIIIIIYRVHCTYIAAMCAIVTIMIAQYLHISVAVDMRTLLDINNFSSSSNGQVAAQRVTGLIIKRIC